MDFLVDESSAAAIDDSRLKTLLGVAIYRVGMEIGKCYLYSSAVDALPHSSSFVGIERRAVAGDVDPGAGDAEYMTVAASLVVASFGRMNYKGAGPIQDHCDQALEGMGEYLSD
jgi:hypothetical protein